MFIGKLGFSFLIFSVPLNKASILSWFFKKLILMGKSDYSQGYSIPLNIDLRETAQQVVLPIDLMKKAVFEDRDYA